MTRIIAVANQKGGVGKTTSTINLAYALASRGKRVLAVDSDPQASLTVFAGQDPYQLEIQEKTLYHALVSDAPIESLIIKGTFDLIPSSIRLASGEAELMMSPLSGPALLRDTLADIQNRYDYILIDCPPTLHLLTVNALAAAQVVLIPVKTDYLSYMGVRLLLDTIEKTRQKANRGLQVLGVLPTLFTARYSHDSELLEVMKEEMSARKIHVFEPINRSTHFDKAPAEGKPTVQLFPDVPGADKYYQLADYIIGHETQINVTG